MVVWCSTDVNIDVHGSTLLYKNNFSYDKATFWKYLWMNIGPIYRFSILIALHSAVMVKRDSFGMNSYGRLLYLNNHFYQEGLRLTDGLRLMAGLKRAKANHYSPHRRANSLAGVGDNIFNQKEWRNSIDVVPWGGYF